MNVDLRYFKAKIETEMENLAIDIKKHQESSAPVAPDNAIGRLTRMEAINAKNISEASLRNAQLRLQKLKAALKRIEKEEFGECLECGENINLKRLESVPEAIICIDCAKKSGK